LFSIDPKKPSLDFSTSGGQGVKREDGEKREAGKIESWEDGEKR
jgi:hypothetical protein